MLCVSELQETSSSRTVPQTDLDLDLNLNPLNDPPLTWEDSWSSKVEGKLSNHCDGQC